MKVSHFRPSHTQDFQLFTVAYANDSKTGSFVVNMTVNGMSLPMVLDTGASCSVLPSEVYFDKFKGTGSALTKSDVRLKTYTGEKIKVLGEFQVAVNAHDGGPNHCPAGRN